MQKVHRFLTNLHADKFMVENATFGDACSPRLVELLVSVDPTSTDDQDVAVLEGCALGLRAGN